MWRRWVILQSFFLVFIDHLWEIWKIRILKKWKKTKKSAGDIIVLHKCTKSHNHMKYILFLRYRVRQNFFCHSGPSFGPFTPHPTPNNPENPNFEKVKKKYLERSSFMPQLLLSILGCFLYFYPRNCLKNENFREWKKHLEISSF